MDRALEVLRLIVLSAEPVLLDELAARVGLSRSIAYRLVRSLENAGYIRRDPRQGGYIVAATFIAMSVQTASRIGVNRALRPAMDAIVTKYGETVSFHIRGGAQRVCVEVAEGTHAIRRVVPIGETHPLYAGETGRVLLSELPTGELDMFVSAAAQDGLDADAIRRDVAQVRRAGYIIGVGMRTPGVGSISTAIFGPAGLAGAMTVSGPADRWSPAVMRSAVPFILDCVRPIMDALGHGPNEPGDTVRQAAH